MLIEDLPPGFVTELISGMESIYPDSHAKMYQDPELGEEQAKTILGHYRRARAETLLWDIAQRHGLRTEVVQPAGGGCTHVSIHLGRFELVMCHVSSRDAFPQHSYDREQSSKVNECIAQLRLFEEPVTPEAGELFGIIIHSEILGRKNKLGSISIGFPNHEWNGWTEGPICLIDISEHQSNECQEEDLQGKIQNEKAKPKLKNFRTVKKAV